MTIESLTSDGNKVQKLKSTRKYEKGNEKGHCQIARAKSIPKTLLRYPKSMKRRIQSILKQGACCIECNLVKALEMPSLIVICLL